MRYGSVRLGPLIFQEDVLHGADGIKQARNANNKMAKVVRKLNLRFNEDKTFCIAIGSVKQRRRIQEELNIYNRYCVVVLRLSSRTALSG